MAIHIHYAGSYGEGARFEIPEVFDADLVFYGYDREEDAASAGWTPGDAKYMFFGTLLSDVEKTVDFYKNVDVWTSSYLKTNQHWPELHYPGYVHDGDYLITVAATPDKVIPLRTTTLDVVAASHNAPVDALIMDTQGAELDILKGGSEQLRSKTLAVFTEIGMAPLYEGQPMFWELAAWLHEAGFMPTSIYPLDYSPYRGRIGWRGKSFHWHGDAMFLKDIDYVAKRHADPRSDLRKLAFLSLSSGYIEYAIEALRRSTQYPAPATPETQIYDRFLDELARMDAESTAPYRISNADTHGFDAATRRERYVASGKSEGISKAIRRLIDNQPDPLTLFLQRYGFNHLISMMDTTTRRDIISTLNGLGYDASHITEEVMNDLEPKKQG